MIFAFPSIPFLCYIKLNLEYWNDGMVEGWVLRIKKQYSIIPIFHQSRGFLWQE
jgi:hypothetical protein